jgi:hypothetical protein
VFPADYYSFHSCTFPVHSQLSYGYFANQRGGLVNIDYFGSDFLCYNCGFGYLMVSGHLHARSDAFYRLEVILNLVFHQWVVSRLDQAEEPFQHIFWAQELKNLQSYEQQLLSIIRFGKQCLNSIVTRS